MFAADEAFLINFFDCAGKKNANCSLEFILKVTILKIRL